MFWNRHLRTDQTMDGEKKVIKIRRGLYAHVDYYYSGNGRITEQEKQAVASAARSVIDAEEEAALAADGEAGGEAAGGEAAGGEVGGEAGGEALDLEGAESSVDAPPSDDVENAEGAAAEGA